MSRRTLSSLEFDAISIEGGLLPAEWLAKVALLDAPQQGTADYSLRKGLNLRDELGRYWRIAQAHWADFHAARRQSHDPQLISQRLIRGLLEDVFEATDIELLNAPELIAERTYPITARAAAGRLPLVVGPHDALLDARLPRFGDAGRQRSAFGLLQDYLNAADTALWGIASNGLLLRLVRDNASLTRPAWIEADLERIFGEDRFADFSLLWLLIHISRFGKPGQPPEHCALEAWREASREEGTRAREQLRGGVEASLLALGQGFLSRPENEALRSALSRGELSSMAYFEQLLRLVYRLIFLLTIEERSLLHPPGSDPAAIELYRDAYALRRLRERARRRRAWDRHGDQWESLKPVWTGLAQGQPLLALPALGGLFGRDQCPHLDTAALGNADLLMTMFKLGWMQSDGSLVRINWRDMGPEEFGSVYESLLELVPEIAADGRQFRFAGMDQSKGNARKTSGSYYTPDSLVQELLDSALEPVIRERTQALTDPAAIEAVLLTITVCDPACGSGHFLLGAARRIAQHLARVRAGGTPSGDDFRHALRDVIGHCIYGVDRNPMALELARTSLWLEAMTPDKPLGFLDHHLQCGDALLGVLDPKILAHGIPSAAFSELSGDDKAVASALKKRNTVELASFHRAIAAENLFRSAGPLTDIASIEALADDDLSAIASKQRAWQQAAAQARSSLPAQLADVFVAAFLLPKRKALEARIPTSQDLWQLGEQGRIDADKLASARAVCVANRVFHWWLAFPQVAAQGGFTVMLGNPPWEQLQLSEEEFFAPRAPAIAAMAGAQRKRAIAELEVELPRLWQEFVLAQRAQDSCNEYFRAAGRFPLTAVGKLNTYALFAESFSQLVADTGRAGIIVPTGIATDDSTKAFFGTISRGGHIASLYDIENSTGTFPGVHRSYKFCLLTIGAAEASRFVCFATSTSDLSDARRAFALSPEDFALINPNTGTCPIFRSQRDAELTKKLYGRAPVFIRETYERRSSVGRAEQIPEANPWDISFSQGLFNMTGDSGLFLNEPNGLGPRLPLIEAKMIHHFDHRWATYVVAPDRPNGLDTADVTDAQKSEPGFTVRPRYWVDQCEVLARIARVPARVATAWLARTKTPAGDYAAQIEADATLRWALASWVATELYLRARDFLRPQGHQDDNAHVPAAQQAESELGARFPAYIQALRAGGLNSKKLPTELAKWARQDPGSRLDDYELLALTSNAATHVDAEADAALMPLLDRWMDTRSPRWLLGWRDICRSTDERTVIASVMPRAAVGHTTPLWFSNESARLQAALLACLDSLVLDYIARQKVGGTHLTYGFLKQFPVLPPNRYTEADLGFIVPRVLELTYTAHDLAPWAADLGYSGPPFAWNPERRAQLRAELDAYYARLYGLTRDELRYILDPADIMGPDYPSETFRVLKNNETRQFGEYRTQRLVLAAWDQLESGARA